MTRVLIAEDECVTRECAKLALQSQGFQVTAVGTGSKALELLTSKRYDIALLDLKMPGLDGLEVVKHLRKSNTPYRSTPVIAVTAFSKEDFSNAEKNSVNAFLTKPYAHTDLINTVRRYGQ